MKIHPWDPIPKEMEIFPSRILPTSVIILIYEFYGDNGRIGVSILQVNRPWRQVLLRQVREFTENEVKILRRKRKWIGMLQEHMRFRDGKFRAKYEDLMWTKFVGLPELALMNSLRKVVPV